MNGEPSRPLVDVDESTCIMVRHNIYSRATCTEVVEIKIDYTIMSKNMLDVELMLTGHGKH
jgi:hypothetical protein